MKVKIIKLLILSDSHKNTDRMLYAADQVKPDEILHLGDHIADAYEFQKRLPDIMIYMVKGNCDFYSMAETELFLDFAGTKIYMTHGHQYGVKSGFDALIKRARQQRADLVLFGHTHQAIMRQENGLWLMNPGQIGRHDDHVKASYGVVTIDSGVFECGIVYLQ
jgi:putative phosphoesterase